MAGLAIHHGPPPGDRSGPAPFAAAREDTGGGAAKAAARLAGCRRPGDPTHRHPVGDDAGGTAATSPGGGNSAAGGSRAGHRDGGTPGGTHSRRGQGGRPPGPAAPGPASGRGRCNAVTGHDVPERDMPNFTGPSRWDAPLISDAALAALLAGAELPPGAAPQLRPLAEALAELTGAPVGDELAGEAATLTAFREHFGPMSSSHYVSRNRRSRPRPRHLPLRAAAAAATIVGLGSLATAAYAAALPAGMQHLAHDVIGAPEVGAQPAARPSPAIPAASGQPGHGLCAAWTHAKAHGTRKQRAVAFRELAAAAGGPANVTAYCTATAHTATPPSSHPAPTPSQHSGEPTSLPTPHGSGKPTALPTPHGSGKPTALPTPHGSGEPTGQPAPRRAEMLAQQERSAPPVTLRR